MPTASRTVVAKSPLSYAAALGSAAAALALRVALDPLLEDRQPYVTTYAGIAFAAWFGGARAGLLSAAASFAGVGLLFVPPRGVFGYATTGDLVGAGAFCFTSTIVLLVTTRMRAAQAAAEDAAARALASQAALATEMEERRRVEEELRASQEGLLVAQQAAEAGTWDLDRSTGHLRWSEHHRVLLGLPPGTPPAVDVWLEGVDPRDRAAVARVLGSEASVLRVTFRIHHPERGERWLASWGRTWTPRHGGPPRMAGITRDVTDEKRAADAVQAGEERLRLVAKAARMAIWDLDLATGRIEGSAETGPLFGRPPDRLHDDVAGWARQIHPEDRAETVRRLEGMRHGREYHARYRIQPDDGGPVRWLEGVGAPLCDEEGRPVRAVGCVFDVTERMQAETVLREQTALLQTIVHRLPVLIAYLDTDLRYRLNSESYTDWFGLPLSEVTGRHIGDVVGPTAMETLGPHLRRALDGHAVRFEAEVAYTRGGARCIEAAYVPHVVDDRVLGLVVFVHDVTARRQAEDALRRADRAKDEFLAMLGHELRNPLASVRNAIVTARLDEAHRERALEIADRQTDQLRRLVDDLLDVARVTQGKITLHTEPVLLSEVVQRAVEAATQAVEERGQTLAVSLPAEPVVLEADVARIQQVFGNLLANASRYTPAGGRIEISAATGAEVVVRVRDTGSGIPADVLPHVFDLFVQAERPLDRAHGGLGVGLTVVRRLVELHGGRVTAHSAGRDAGSEFAVVLPVMASHPDEHDPPRLPHGTTHGSRVLLVEDNADAADAVRMLLELLGHQVRVASDGPSALAQLAASLPDVVVLDIGLPGMDGYEVAQRIRADARTRHLPIVALTGYGRTEDATRAAASGIDRHLVKPVDPDALHALLLRLRTDAAAAS
ncbi:MAG: response regulator [bacterium]|nr:response regulator [bacterium]